jgi:hypothetical protein
MRFEAFDIKRMRARLFQHVPVDDDLRGTASFADRESRDVDVGQAAVLLKHRRVPDQPNDLSLHCARCTLESRS